MTPTDHHRPKSDADPSTESPEQPLRRERDEAHGNDADGLGHPSEGDGPSGEMGDPAAQLDEGLDEGLDGALDGALARAVAERDDAVAAKRRAQADFANYQRRAAENERRALLGGMGAVVRSLLPALDNLDRALEADPERITVEQLRDGVRMVRGEIGRALESHGVEAVAPAIGDEFDPHRHEALMRQPSDDIKPDHVLSVLQNGYAMGETILRPAKVILAASVE